MTDTTEATAEPSAEGTAAPAVEAQPTETATPEPAAEPEKRPEKTAARFAAIQRQLRETRRAQEQIAAEKAAIEAERKSWQQQREGWEREAAEVRELRDLLKEARKNPALLVQKGVVDYEELTRSLLNDGRPSPELVAGQVREEVTGELATLREELAAIRKEREEERQRAEAEQAKSTIARIRSDIGEHLAKHADDYELTTQLGYQDEIIEVMRLAAQERNVLLSVKEAADHVERFLEEQAKKVTGAKKIRTLLAPPDAPAKAPQAKPNTDARARSASPTLTNGNVTAPATGGEKPRKKTVEELREEAIRAAREAVAASRAGAK